MKTFAIISALVFAAAAFAQTNTPAYYREQIYALDRVLFVEIAALQKAARDARLNPEPGRDDAGENLAPKQAPPLRHNGGFSGINRRAEFESSKLLEPRNQVVKRLLDSINSLIQQRVQFERALGKHVPFVDEQPRTNIFRMLTTDTNSPSSRP